MANMAVVVTDEIKLRFMQAGIWKAFNDRRAEMKREGSTPVNARKAAMAEYEKIYAQKVAEGSQMAAVDLPGTGNAPSSSSVSGVSDEGEEFDFSVFDGKPSVGVVSAIQWVAKNLENDGVKVSDAPSPEAWGMLMSYRQSALRKNDFWDKIFAKLIPSKAQLEENDGDDELDDAGLVEVIDRLLAIRDKAKKEAAA